MALSRVDRVDFGLLRSCRTADAAVGTELIIAPRTDVSGNSSATTRLSDLSWEKRVRVSVHHY